MYKTCCFILLLLHYPSMYCIRIVRLTRRPIKWWFLSLLSSCCLLLNVQYLKYNFLTCVTNAINMPWWCLLNIVTVVSITNHVQFVTKRNLTNVFCSFVGKFVEFLHSQIHVRLALQQSSSKALTLSKEASADLFVVLEQWCT